jgi:hypothetical protein
MSLRVPHAEEILENSETTEPTQSRIMASKPGDRPNGGRDTTGG